MSPTDLETQAAGAAKRRRLFYFNGGFFQQKTVRRILNLAGFDLQLGKPDKDDLVAVWGKSPTSHRGEKVSEITGATPFYVEDAFLRSVGLGRDGTAPLGLCLDRQRPHFDSSGPSDLEELLAGEPFDDTAFLNRAKAAMARIKDHHITKYNTHDAALAPPPPGYVLVIDQTRDDASVVHGGGSVGTFREMLVFAQEEHRGAQIIIKTHPDTVAAHREGYFSQDHATDQISLLSDPISPYALLEGAIAVYTVSSGMGFEAIIAGHKPVVFGQPFYAGWGLSDDRQPIDRRQRKLTRTQLFAGAMMTYPKWYDPYRDESCALEDVLAILEAQTRPQKEDQQGYTALSMKPWKRKHLQDFFGRVHPLVFSDSPKPGTKTLVWGSKPYDFPALRIEDGFLRSQGLGAQLIPPLSLVMDDLGIYFDPSQPSRLEQMISDSLDLSDASVARARALRKEIIRTGVSKYNPDADSARIDEPNAILVVGQVEDDASIVKGAPLFQTNAELCQAVRTDFPDARLIYKPHPDVEAGLRASAPLNDTLYDTIASASDPVALLENVTRVCTNTSLLGFEALLREVPVTCYGNPFYAGWGLTDDRAGPPSRRRARPSLDQLTHAALIDYPRYFDPVTSLPCPPEVALHRLATGGIPAPSRKLWVLARLQNRLARFSSLWRG